MGDSSVAPAPHGAGMFLPHLSRLKVLVGMGILAEVFYLTLSLSFPLPRLYASIPPWDFAKLTGYSLASVFLLLIAYSMLFGGLAWVMWGSMGEARQGEITRVRRLVYGGAGTFALTLLFLYPIYAIDLFLYVVHTRIWLVHGANPLLVPPARFPGDVWMVIHTVRRRGYKFSY